MKLLVVSMSCAVQVIYDSTDDVYVELLAV